VGGSALVSVEMVGGGVWSSVDAERGAMWKPRGPATCLMWAGGHVLGSSPRTLKVAQLFFMSFNFPLCELGVGLVLFLGEPK